MHEQLNHAMIISYDRTRNDAIKSSIELMKSGLLYQIFIRWFMIVPFSSVLLWLLANNGWGMNGHVIVDGQSFPLVNLAINLVLILVATVVITVIIRIVVNDRILASATKTCQAQPDYYYGTIYVHFEDESIIIIRPFMTISIRRSFLRGIKERSGFIAFYGENQDHLFTLPKAAFVNAGKMDEVRKYVETSHAATAHDRAHEDGGTK
jgi:hypothetical protein